MSSGNPYYVGLQNVGSYQVSGIPFVTGAVNAPVSTNTPTEITFPSVTQRVLIENIGSYDVKVGFSSNGVKDGKYFLVHSNAGGGVPNFHVVDLRVKVSSIYILSNDSTHTSSVCVAAELTNIDTSLLELSGPSGPNWSGSLGVG